MVMKSFMSELVAKETKAFTIVEDNAKLHSWTKSKMNSNRPQHALLQDKGNHVNCRWGDAPNEPKGDRLMPVKSRNIQKNTLDFGRNGTREMGQPSMTLTDQWVAEEPQKARFVVADQSVPRSPSRGDASTNTTKPNVAMQIIRTIVRLSIDSALAQTRPPNTKKTERKPLDSNPSCPTTEKGVLQ